MEDLSNIQAVIITPVSQILPFAAVVGLISGMASGVLAVAIRRWQSRPPMARSILLFYPLIGVLLLTGAAFFTWNTDPTKSVAMLRQECLVPVPALFAVPVVDLLRKLGLDDLFKDSAVQNGEEE